MLVSIAALCDNINELYNLTLNPLNQTFVTKLLTCGLNLPSIDNSALLNMNSDIFSIFSSYILQTARFVKML